MRKRYNSHSFPVKSATSVLTVFILFLLSATTVDAQILKIDESQIVERNGMIMAPAPDMGEICTLDHLDTDAHYHVKRHDLTAKWMSEVRSSEFEIDYVNNCGDQVWPQQARQAFEYALSIWESHLDSSVPIRIRANWVEQEGNTLGSAGPTQIFQLQGAEPNTWYTIAQAAAMTGQDLVQEFDLSHDININMNCNFANWYYGLDANTPSGQIDFVTVVLHEVGHGIGFIGSMSANDDNQNGGYGFGENNDPIIYDRFTEDGDGVALLNTGTYQNPSQNLYQALTGQRGGVFFTGNEAIGVNAAQPVPLFAPSEWSSGSSYSHVDQATFTQTENALMRPQIEQAFAMHSPGPIFCGMLSDWGWPLGASCLELVGAEAIIAVSESDLDFGVTNVGSPVERTFEISNDESAEDPLSYNIQIDSDNFSVTPSAAASGSLQPGESTEITIRYNPNNDRIHTGQIRLSHNAMNASSPINISLGGEALQRDEIARLEDNYPNPFNPSTTIPYVLPQTSNVRLDLFNISGQLVRTIVNEQQGEGRYELEINISDLSSGVYIYRLIVDDFIDSKKMMLVK
ncbi:MAG: choice-of-anchor D domain-containing protein [Balneolaceae bacterium]|nr:choice-of-anchor D domain-containing protein [Balneolaceae bacterium]MCH8548420.1 choice-of-anchor D domain-containing protein [Balneolaceae bacterium]